MPDRDTVIKELQNAPNTVKDGFYYLRITHKLRDDAIALLKEQESVKPIYNEEKYGDHLLHCGNCEKVLPNNAVYGKVNFCHYCGKAVKWND